MRKRIAIIIPGGIGVGPLSQGIPILETFLEQLALDHDIVVFPLGRVDAGYVPRGFRVKAISDDYDGSLLKRIFKTVLLLRKMHRQERFDWLHGIWTFPSGFLAALLGKIWRVESLISLQGGGLVRLKNIGYGGRLRFINRLCIRWALNNADHLSAESYSQRELVSDRRIRERIAVIPYGVDTGLFSFQPKPLEEPLKFIHIANLNPVKDQETLIRAFELIRQQLRASLTIVGPDYLGGKIQQLVYRLDLAGQVHFAGFVPHKEIPLYLAQAHFLLHTSRHEGMPLAAVEAMASGVVVCGTKVGIISDLSPGCCIGVPVGDYAELAEQVIHLVSHKDKYTELQRKAREWTQQFTIDWTCRQFKNIYALNSRHAMDAKKIL